MPPPEEGTLFRDRKTGQTLELRGDKWFDVATNKPVGGAESPLAGYKDAAEDVLHTIPGAAVRGGVGLVTSPFTAVDTAGRVAEWGGKKFPGSPTAQAIVKGGQNAQ